MTTLIAGTPIRGSWWGHPAGHAIYETLHELEHSPDVAFVRLINGKGTILHRRLWPPFFAIVSRRSAWQTSGLDESAKGLLRFVNTQHEIRIDRLPPSFHGSPASWSPPARRLESRLLIDTDNVHTESGRHVLLLRSWRKRMAQLGIRPGRMTVGQAVKELEEVGRRLSENSGATVRFPWNSRVGSRRKRGSRSPPDRG